MFKKILIDITAITAINGAVIGGIYGGHRFAKFTFENICRKDPVIVRALMCSVVGLGGIAYGACAGAICLPIIILTSPITVPIFQEYYKENEIW